MQTPILSSTALLTVLMSVGLVFFIRASTKDRIQVAKLVTPQQGEPLLEQIQQYFTQRSYRIAAVDEAKNQVTFEGFVRPSVFLAIFLSLLAAVGLLCLALVLSFALPSATPVLPALALLSPLAGLFYWKKSGRPEQVLLQVETGEAAPSVLTVTAHRDELAELQRSLNLKPLEE
ncbi:cofactor assembly of complex C subunit B [Phormidium tenue FACHB-886]|nr:cofactor assembly of complex C subunit B [Phormidium tenue FACHB-886]